MMQENGDKLQFLPNDYIHAVFNEGTSAYYAQFTISNQTPHRIYFYVVSTFAKYCQIRLNNLLPLPRYIKSQQKLQIQCKIKRTNQIDQKIQKILISYGIQDNNAVYIKPNAYKQSLNIRFYQEFIQDEGINDILKADAQSLCEQGHQLRMKGSYAKAINCYEQGYQLFRPFVDSLYGLALCQLKIGMLHQSIKNIECALIGVDRVQFEICKIKILLGFAQKGNLNVLQIFNDCKLMLESILKNDQIQMNLKKQIGQEIIDISAQIEAEVRKIRLKQIDEYIYLLPQKLRQRFSSDQQLKMMFQDERQLEEVMKQILNNQQNNRKNVETPQYVLDSVTYEIMKQPMIVPSGASYQKSFLNSYFNKHGFKDPITRKQIHPDLIFPNLTFQQFIRLNPDLVKWEAYEKLQLKFDN